MAEPTHCTLIPPEVAVAHGQAVEQLELARVLAETLSVVVHCGVPPALQLGLQTFLLPELIPFHIYEECFHLLSIPFDRWHD